MKQNILIVIIAVVIIAVALTLYFREKKTTQVQNPTSTQGMNSSMPGMDHSKMPMGQ